MVGQREAEQVGRESSQIEPRVRAPARLEAIEIKATVNAVVDAMPTECAMDRSPGWRPTRGGPLPDLLNRGTEATHEIRSSGQALKTGLRTCEHSLEPVLDKVSLHVGKHDLASVQVRQCPSNPACTVLESRGAALVPEILPEVHPRIEVVEDEARLSFRPRHRPRYSHALQYLCLMQEGCRREVSLGRSLFGVEPPGKDSRFRRSSAGAGDSQQVAALAVAASTAACYVNSAGLEPRAAAGELCQL